VDTKNFAGKALEPGLDFMDTFALGLLLAFFTLLWVLPLLALQGILPPGVADSLLLPGAALAPLAAGVFGLRKTGLGWREAFAPPRLEPVPMTLFTLAWVLLLAAEVAAVAWLGPDSPRILAPEGSPALTALSMVLIAPLSEEFFFRAVLCRGLGMRYGRTAGILLSAALFALCHLRLASFPGTFLFGCLMGWGQLRWRTALPCVLVHAAHNALAVAALRHPGLALAFLALTSAAALAWAFIPARKPAT
jgi:membrane protease YdiL (CAAX protease family)